MKKNLRFRLMELASVPIITIGILVFLLVNYIISKNIEQEFKAKLDISADYLTQEMESIIENEKDKLTVIASDRDLNMMLKYGVKVTSSADYLVDGFEKDKNAYKVYYKIIEKNIDYLTLLNILKKTLYKEPRMSEISLEIFDKNGKKVISSYGQYLSEEYSPENESVGTVLNKDSVFAKKSTISDVVEYDGRFYFKVGVPVPERTIGATPEGAIVLTYPIDSMIVEKMKKLVGSDIVILTQDMRVVEKTYYEEDADFLKIGKSISTGEKVTIEKDGKTFMVKAVPLIGAKGKTVGYIAMLKDKSEIDAIKKFSFFIIFAVVIFMIIITFFIVLYESSKIAKPINKFLDHIENIKDGNYAKLEDIKLIPEIDRIRESFNSMVEKTHKSMEEIKKRDDTLIMMNQELLAIIKEKDRMYKLSITDGLTSVYNHKYFQELLAAEVERSLKYRIPISLVMIDIDFFKNINDSFGHQKGDEILQKVAEKIKYFIREGDTIARYGGEEFVLILPNTDQNGGFIFAERLRKMIEDSEFEGRKITISCGTVSYPYDFDEEESETLKSSSEIKNELIKKADTALYFSKNSGRNKTTKFEKYLEIKKSVMSERN